MQEITLYTCNDKSFGEVGRDIALIFKQHKRIVRVWPYAVINARELHSGSTAFYRFSYRCSVLFKGSH